MTHDETDRTTEEPQISTPSPPPHAESDHGAREVSGSPAGEPRPTPDAAPADGTLGGEPEPASPEPSPAPDAEDGHGKPPEPASNGNAGHPGVAAPPTIVAQESPADESPVPNAVPLGEDHVEAADPEAVVRLETPPVAPESEAEAAAPVDGDGDGAGETSATAVEPSGAALVESTDATAPVETDGSEGSPDTTVTGTSRPPRPRRKRRSAAERHRGVFFAKLGELRRSANVPSTATAAEPSNGSAMVAPLLESARPPETEAETPLGVDATAPMSEPAADPAPVAADGPAAPAAESAERDEDAQQSPTTTGPAAEAVAEAPAVEGPGAEEPAAADDSAPTPARVQARLAASIEGVGGVEVVREALQPKRNEKGEPLKWAAVCCDAAEGKAPGDPVFLAWVRLASTPVREIKAQIRPPRDDRGGGGRGPRRGSQSGGERGGKAGGERGGGRSSGGGGAGRGQGDRRPRSGGGRDRDRSIEDAAKDLLRDGSFRPSVRIVGGDDDEKRERERLRKEKREAKRQAERERLARLGY